MVEENVKKSFATTSLVPLSEETISRKKNDKNDFVRATLTEIFAFILLLYRDGTAMMMTELGGFVYQ